MTASTVRVDAAYWEPRDQGAVACCLCPQLCSIAPGRSGTCGLRTNEGGVLRPTAYGEVASVAVDPVEKKPLYHFHPGTQVLSLGPNGCNLKCRGCQNFEISQEAAPTHYLSPEALVELAAANNTPGISYTYTEPLVWFEYVRDACAAARARGLFNVAVTNGYLEEAPARELAAALDAANIDVKSMSESFYRDYCGGALAPVLRTCEIFKKHIHLEITSLLVPGFNDEEDEIGTFVAWVKTHLGPETPVHFSRYFPRYRMDTPATPIHHILRAKEIADRDLYYVYIGNVAGVGGTDTVCPECANLLIAREGYRVRIAGIRDGKCANCGRVADVVL